MTMKVADLEVRSITVRFVDFHCKDLDYFRDMPKAIRFRNNVYYKRNFHPVNLVASYMCEPDPIHEVEEDVTGHALYDPKVLVSSDGENQDLSEWVPLDVLEKGMVDGTYDHNSTGIFKTSRNFDWSLN